MTLEYWNNLANQIILISVLLSGFSITIVANLIVHEKNDRLTNGILKTATLSAGSFLVTLFAMTKIAMLTIPGGYLKNVTEADFFTTRIIGMTTFMLGLVCLSILIGLSGWTKSKRVGIFTTVVGVMTFLLMLLTTTTISF